MCVESQYQDVVIVVSVFMIVVVLFLVIKQCIDLEKNYREVQELINNKNLK